MLNKTNNTINPIDWAGCIPVVGSAVGLVEIVYNFGLLIFSTFAKKSDAEIVGSERKYNSLFNRVLILQKQAKEIPQQEVALQKTYEIDLLLKDCTACHKKWERSVNKYDEKTDQIANKFFTGLLRATWFGAIGICAYKLLK